MTMPRIALAQACALATIAATATAAQAQSSVEVYGILDVGVEVNDTGVSGSGRNYVMNTGNMSASRLGFRGTEDLGGGLKAVFNTEIGFAPDTGTIITYGEPVGTLFGRRAIVGLKGDFGEIDLGRDYTPAFWTLIQTDRFRYGLPGTVSTASQITVTRANNGIFYVSPTVGGFLGRLAYTFGAESATEPKDLGRLASASVEYKSGNWFASAAVQRRSDLVPGSKTQSTRFKEGGGGVEYTRDPYVLTAGFWRTDPVTATAGAVDKSRAYWVGAGLKVGSGQFNVQVTRTRFDMFGAAGGKAVNYGVEYLHYLSKRTTLYAAYGGVNNDAHTRLALNTGSQRVGGAELGADPKAFIMGVRHLF